MRVELKKIISKSLETNRLKEDLIFNANNLIDYYEENRKEITSKLKVVLQKYNSETIGKFSKNNEEEISIAFCNSIGELSFDVILLFDNGGEIDDELREIIKDPNVHVEPAFESIEDEYFYTDKIAEVYSSIFYTYLCSIWQEIKGNDYGIVFLTLENNSATKFFLYDYAWENESVFKKWNSKINSRHEINATLLTTKDIFERVSVLNK